MLARALPRSIGCFLLSCIALGVPAARATEFITIAGWDEQLFPSFLIASGAVRAQDDGKHPQRLGDPGGLIGVQIVAPHDDTYIELEISGDEFLEPSRLVATLPQSGETYQLFPKIKYRYERLSQCQQVTPSTLTYRLILDDQPAEEATSTAIFRPVHDCPVLVRDGDQVVDLSFTFAAFVNEQHPFTDKLLREALDIGVVDNFVGYQAKSEGEVVRQVYALWDLLVARDVRYSSITRTAAAADNVQSQHVRLLEDTINNQQANCVDGSVLLVSLLRKIDIEAFLVLVPGHCYVGFYLDEEHTRALGVETTLMGADVPAPDAIDEVVDAAIAEHVRGEKSWPSFLAALQVGTQNLVENTDKFVSPDAFDYRLIDVAAVRRSGVLPIPFRGHEAFLAFEHSRYVSADGSDGRVVTDEEGNVVVVDTDAEDTSDETYVVDADSVEVETSYVDSEDEDQDEDEDEDEDDADDDNEEDEDDE